MPVREVQFHAIEKDGKFQGFEIIQDVAQKTDKTTIEQGRMMIVTE
jgi:hypothetical protein